MKIGFYGGYTLYSAGDDAPLHFITTELRRLYKNKDIEFVVFARHPNKAFDDFYGVRTIQNLEYENKKLSSGRWMRGFNYDDNREILKELIDEIADCDLLVLGAGNFLSEVSLDFLRGHLAQFVAMTQLADFARTPVMLFGLSANKLESKMARLAVDWMFRRSAAITFREPKAIENLEASSVNLEHFQLLPDPVLSSPQAPHGTALRILSDEGLNAIINTETLAVSVRDIYWLGVNDKYLSLMTRIINAWLAKEGADRTVLFIPQCTYHQDNPSQDDRYVADMIVKGVEEPGKCFIIRGEYFSSEVESLYSKAAVTVATRLHGSVFSAKMGIPVVGLAYEDKVKGFFQTLGRPDWCFALDEDYSTVVAKLESLVDSRETEREKILQVVHKLQLDTRKYIDIISELLAKAR